MKASGSTPCITRHTADGDRISGLSEDAGADGPQPPHEVCIPEIGEIGRDAAPGAVQDRADRDEGDAGLPRRESEMPRLEVHGERAGAFERAGPGCGREHRLRHREDATLTDGSGIAVQGRDRPVRQPRVRLDFAAAVVDHTPRDHEVTRVQSRIEAARVAGADHGRRGLVPESLCQCEAGAAAHADRERRRPARHAGERRADGPHFQRHRSYDEDRFKRHACPQESLLATVVTIIAKRTACAVGDRMRLTFLGVGNAFAPGGLGWNGFVVDDDILFDVPPDTLARLHGLSLDPLRITHIGITHLHADHYSGLPMLLQDFGLRSLRREPLVIVGPGDTASSVARLVGLLGAGDAEQVAGFEQRFVVSPEDGETDFAGGRLAAVRMVHSRTQDCFGYRLTRGARTLAYSGDATLSPALVALGTGADLLVVECSSTAEEDPSHMNLRLVTELRQSLPASTRILLSHREVEVSNHRIDGVEVAEAGGRYDV